MATQSATQHWAKKHKEELTKVNEADERAQLVQKEFEVVTLLTCSSFLADQEPRTGRRKPRSIARGWRIRANLTKSNVSWRVYRGR